jgi:hypothetical protein
MSIDTLQHCKFLGHEEVVNDDRLDLHFMLHLIILHAVMPRVVRGGRIGWLCTLDAVQACTRHRPVVSFWRAAPQGVHTQNRC